MNHISAMVHCPTITFASKLILYLEHDLWVSFRDSGWFKCNWQFSWWSGHFSPLDCRSCLMNLRAILSQHNLLFPLISSAPLPSSTLPLITYLLWSLLYWPLFSVICCYFISGDLTLKGCSTRLRQTRQEITVNCFLITVHMSQQIWVRN